MSNAELREMLANDYPDAVLIGDHDEVEKYFPAIVGIDYNNGRVIYDRDKLAECFASEDGLTLEEAADHICCNVDRSLPYMGGGRQYSCPQSKHLNRGGKMNGTRSICEHRQTCDAGAAVLGALVALVVGAMGVMTLLLGLSIATGRALI